MTRSSVALLWLALAACTPAPGDDDDSAAPDAAVVDAGAPDAAGLDASFPDAAPVDAGPAWLPRLEALADYQVLQGSAGDVKYLGQVAGVAPQAPVLTPCMFQNMRLYSYHLLFLRSFQETEHMTNQDYTTLVLRPATRVWWGGGVQRLPGHVHPISGLPETVAFTIYADNAGGTGLTEANIREVDGMIKGCAPFAARTLAFAPSDPYQEALVRTAAPSLLDAGVAVLLP